ncbi:MAG: hemolysin III [Desulfuromonas sp.]|nr:MAG: hemolysin III [Desulfuromonas sp.]
MTYHLVAYTAREELANRLTHGLAVLLSVPGLVLMVVAAAETKDPYRIVSTSIFTLALLLFFCISTLYHTFTRPAVRYVFRVLDHAGIFVVIAGTYTPFTLVTLRHGHGWLLFGVVWGLAVVGMIFKTFMTHRLRILAPCLYLCLGWLVVLDLKDLMTTLAPGGFWLLLSGGVIYSLGLIFYAIDKIPYNHAIWHLFVVAGAVCHYLAVYNYVIPLRVSWVGLPVFTLAT